MEFRWYFGVRRCYCGYDVMNHSLNVFNRGFLDQKRWWIHNQQLNMVIHKSRNVFSQRSFFRNYGMQRVFLKDTFWQPVSHRFII